MLLPLIMTNSEWKTDLERSRDNQTYGSRPRRHWQLHLVKWRKGKGNARNTLNRRANKEFFEKIDKREKEGAKKKQ
jgi:hypothetical protein